YAPRHPFPSRSFPTRRSSDLLMAACSGVAALAGAGYVLFGSVAAHSYGDFVFGTELVVWTALGGRGTLLGPILGTVGVNYVSARSEEHTSELQSRGHLVCRLL